MNIIKVINYKPNAKKKPQAIFIYYAFIKLNFNKHKCF